MEVINHDLSYEKVLLDLFGYSLSDKDGSNRWIIYDENNKEVGYIQYKKLFNKNLKKGFIKSFGYCTHIDSSKFYFDNERKLTGKYGEKVDAGNLYWFDIKREDYNTMVEFSLDRENNIGLIWFNDAKHGIYNFKISPSGLKVSFDTKDNNLTVRESIIYHNADDDELLNEFDYEITTYEDVNCKNASTDKYVYVTNFNDNENMIRVTESSYVEDFLASQNKYILEESLEEFVKKYSLVFDSFDRFRKQIKELIPINKDIISYIVNEEVMNSEKLGIFFNNEKSYKRVLK